MLDSGNSELRVVLTQFAHNLLDRVEFWVTISENNWDGIWVVKIGRFWASWCSRSTGRTTNIHIKHNIKATFYTQTTLRSLLSKPKDHIPKEDRNNAVYQLNCKDCEAIYVGETKRTLNIRAEEHITAIKSASKKSHTAEHCWTYNHDFDWKHKKVLDFEKNWKTRTIKESIYSEENEHHINRISFKLLNIWKTILRDSKAKKTTVKTTTSSN